MRSRSSAGALVGPELRSMGVGVGQTLAEGLNSNLEKSERVQVAKRFAPAKQTRGLFPIFLEEGGSGPKASWVHWMDEGGVLLLELGWGLHFSLSQNPAFRNPRTILPPSIQGTCTLNYDGTQRQYWIAGHACKYFDGEAWCVLFLSVSLYIQTQLSLESAAK